MKYIYICCYCCLMLVGCGQTGHLYLPEKLTEAHEHHKHKNDEFLLDIEKNKNITGAKKKKIIPKD